MTANPVHNTGSFVPQLANRIGDGRLPREERDTERWFDAGAFTQPALGTQGNAGRNTVSGPGLAQFDVSISKNTQLSEDLRLQFRAEFFNFANRANFGLPNSNIRSPAVGTIRDADDGRSIQFGLKLVW